jgi:hypothetical protein
MVGHRRHRLHADRGTAEAQQTFRTECISAGTIVIRLIGFLTDLGFRRLRRLLLAWYGDTAEGDPHHVHPILFAE